MHSVAIPAERMASYYTFLCLHILGATIWAGGHIVLALGVLPGALRERNAQRVLDFESRFEVVGMTALAVQVLTGLWLAHHLLGAPGNWFKGNPVAHVVQVKLGLLAITGGLAINARTRVIPRLTNERLPVLAWHITGVTLSAVLFVIAGVTIRFAGYPVFR